LPPNSPALPEPGVFPLPSAAPETIASVPVQEESNVSDDSLFEHFAWLYIFCREKLFRDDTERMIRALWPGGEPADGE
jgi:hypothetical protein